MSEAIPPLPNTPSWRGAQGQIYLYLKYASHILCSILIYICVSVRIEDI